LYEQLCKTVLEIDPQLRFTGVLNADGELLHATYKEGVEKLLTTEEIRMSFHYTLQRRENVSNLSYKIGEEQSCITKFDNVTLISIPLNEKELFLLSTEPNADYFEIIKKTYSLMKNYSV